MLLFDAGACITSFLLSLLILHLPQVHSGHKRDNRRKIPYEENVEFFQHTSIDAFYDVYTDPSVEELARRVQQQNLTQAIRMQMYSEAAFAMEQGDSASQRNYIAITKTPLQPPPRLPSPTWPDFRIFPPETDWFFHSKGQPWSTLAVATLILPVLVAGLLQMIINYFRYSKMRHVSRRSYQFPIVPVLLLQQTRREYFLRKKTVRRFCIQWEVGRINIRMNTRLVDLRQILHPPKKRKKVHKYTTWRIIRLIVRFNAFLALRRRVQNKSQARMKLLLQKRENTWQTNVNTSRYLLEKKLYDDFKEAD